MLSKAKTKLIRSLEVKKRRDAEGLFVAEGPKAVESLCAAFEPVFVAAEPGWLAARRGLVGGAEVAEASPAELAAAGFQKTPQSVLALFRKPAAGRLDIAGGGLYLALDGVQDPGNVGTIVRTAHWFGLAGVVCSPATADVFSPKAVQSTMGSLGAVPVFYSPLPQLLSSLPAGVEVCGAVLGGEDVYAAGAPRSGVLVLGSEGRGISPEVLPMLTRRVTIPAFSPQPPDSLNVAVAAAVLCSEARRA